MERIKKVFSIVFIMFAIACSAGSVYLLRHISKVYPNHSPEQGILSVVLSLSSFLFLGISALIISKGKDKSGAFLVVIINLIGILGLFCVYFFLP